MESREESELATMDPPDAAPDFGEVEQLFRAASPQFLERLRHLTVPSQVARFADGWCADDRAWARLQIFAYLDLPLATDGHQPLLKRLFRQAEKNGDWELLCAFLVAFDRLITHVPRPTAKGDVRLAALRNVIPSFRRKHADDAWHDHRRKTPLPHKGRLFSYRTRYYLRRRAWRRLRDLARRDPQHYLTAAAAVLMRYTDQDLKSGECILDRWGLMQIAYRGSPRLAFTANRVHLRPGFRLAELRPDPAFPHVWQTSAAADVLLRLTLDAGSHLVRFWSSQVLRQWHGDWLRTLSPAFWLPLLDHRHQLVRDLAFEVMQTSESWRTLPLDECLPLVETRYSAARRFVVRWLAERAASAPPTRTDALALAKAAPRTLAEIGFRALQELHGHEPLSDHDLASLVAVRCRRLAGDTAAWALESLRNREPQSILPFFNHSHAEVRRAACAWWQKYNPDEIDVRLWEALCGSVHADVQRNLIVWLARHSGDSMLGSVRPVPTPLLPGAMRLWVAVLSSPATNVRTFTQTLDQSSMAAMADASLAEQLLPTLVGLIRKKSRSLWEPALVATVRLAKGNASFRDLLSEQLPELQWEEACLE